MQSTLHWPGLRTEHAWLPPHEGASHTKPRQIGVSFSSHTGIVCAHEGRSCERDIRTGAVWVTGESGITWTRVREHTEALEMYPDASLLERAADASSNRIVIGAALGASDPVTVGIASVFRRAHAAGLPLGDVEASQLAWRLVTHLLDRYSNRRPAADHYVGLLDRVRLRRVCDFIEANLGEPMGVVEMASLYGVTPFHFTRSFKRTMGLTPHQYVTMRRLATAKDLLMETHRPVIEIAYGLGFRNLSHFRRIFRSFYGASPGAVRQQDSTPAANR